MVSSSRIVGFAVVVLTTTVVLMPASAQVSASGDAFPTVSDDFPIPTIDLFTEPAAFGFPDDDDDNVVDFILPAGNTIDASFLDPVAPMGGETPGTLPWNDPFVWRGYENRQNVLVGQTSTGTLAITGNADLRFQHLVLGGPGEEDPQLNPGVSFNDGLYLAADNPQEAADFDFTSATLLNAAAFGTGIVTISGPGASYNNDPQVISASLLSILNAAAGAGGGGADDFYVNGSPDGDVGTPGSSNRDPTEDDGFGYDVHVGYTGSGILDVNGGGLLEIQDALFVGLGASATGTVTVDGAGSLLNANGRDEFDPTTAGDSSNPLADFASIVGGNGSGNLSVTNGGRANFSNGLSIGADNSGATFTGTGNGSVLVDGPGATVSVLASAALESPTTGNVLALAVGELRNSTMEIDPAMQLGSGTLEIGVGGTVNVTFSDSYALQDAVDANAEIGRNGELLMRGGQLLVGAEAGIPSAAGGQLVNDGLIEGYGFIRANQVINTALSTIEGDAELGPLRMIVNSDMTEPTDADFAFLNLGTIEGNVAITVNGGFSNGDPSLTPVSNGGVLRASGSIQSATFFNRPDAEVFVAEGETLSIRAVGDITVMTPEVLTGPELSVVLDPLIGDTPTPAAYSQANLGSISVNGGTLEVGALLTGTPTGDHRFRNARQVDGGNAELALGQINSNDGTLVFHTGLLNTGVLSFTGGDNVVAGEVLNSNEIDYDGDAGVTTPGIPGIIVVSGDETSVTFTENVTNDGVISIGPTSNVVNFLGDLTSSGTFGVAFAGFAEPSSAIVVSNDVTLFSGDVVVNLLTAGPVVPGAGIPLLTFGGELTVEAAPALLVEGGPTDQTAGLSVSDGVLSLVFIDSVTDGFLLGDANGDGLVDAADYTVWRESTGSAVLAGTAGDFNANGFVDGDDLSTWRLNFGRDLSIAGPLAVPEPGAAALALLAAVSAIGRRRRR